MSQLRVALAVAVGAVAVLVQGCTPEGCLGGDPGCKVVSPCQAVTFTCEANPELLKVRTLPADVEAPGGMDALGGKGDVLLQNEHLQVVISAIGNQNGVDPNGGTIIDLAVRGLDNDGLNSVAATTGLLPRDALRYTELEILDERPTRVAVQVKGALDGYPDTRIHTVYELRPCDRGVRIRSEVINGWNQPQTWALSDVFYWQDREPISFVSGPGLGYRHPALALTTANQSYRAFPFMAAASIAPPYASYAHVSCNVQTMEGLNNDFISLSGLPRQVVSPREYRIFERLLIVEDGRDVAASADTAMAVRAQLFGEEYVVLEGKVERAGALALDTSRETMIVIYEGDAGMTVEELIPWTQVVPDATGAWSAKVPKGKTYFAEVYSFGQVRVEKELGAIDGDTDVGTFTLPSTARVTVRVREGASANPTTAMVFVVPQDEEARKQTEGTHAGHEWVSLSTLCSPWLGPEYAGSPACNRILVENGQVTVEVPMGRYHFYAFKGPFWTIDRETVTLGDGDVTLTLNVEELPLQPAQTLTADLHVHSGTSFDSSLPQKDRVLSFDANELQVIVASEHDVAWDFQSTIDELGLQNKMSSVAGVETTAQIPFLSVPGDPFPRVIGHYIFFPIAFNPGLPRNGGPFDDLIEPGELFDRVDPLYTGTVPLIQLPHPWGGPYFGRDTGWHRALNLDLRENLPATDDGTRAGMFVRVPNGGNANDAHHAQEVMNGTDNSSLQQYRAVWFYMLNQGKLKAGTANSDSHSLTDNTVGTPRNVVYTQTQAGQAFDVNTFNQSIRDGRFFGTNGPVIEAVVRGSTGPDQPFGLAPIAPPADAKVAVKLTAAPWVPVQEIRFVVNGNVVKTLGPEALTHPTEPFGAGGLVRYEGEVALSELLAGVQKDAWLVIEAGDPLPLAGDLGGGQGSGDGCAGQIPDGVPDTGDNNGDGKVDCGDVEEGKDYGPLNIPTPPVDESHPRFHFSRVVHNGYPFAYTNPFVIDRDGNGKFDAPGAQGAK